LSRRLSATWMCSALLCLTFVPQPASAQSQANTGTIEGVVVDPSGAAIPEASVTVLNVDTNYQRKVMTDEAGRFRVVLLPLGGYKVPATATRFGTLVRQGLDLAVGQTISLNLNLSVANVAEAISVEADAPVIETSASESSSYIDKNSIRTLPNNGRNFY